ncbi:MAG: DsbA family protein [Patescibacteria group bacterium]|nr:DsbA family protein [Patescibacteria group bacterium]
MANLPITNKTKIPAPQPLPQRRWWRTWWGISLIIFGVLIVLFIVSVSWYALSVLGQRAQDTTEQVTIVDMNKLLTADDPGFGSTKAKVEIVEFVDFQCPFSGEAFPTVRKMMSEYGDRIYFVYRDYPGTDIHPDAERAAEAAACANEQDKFWEFHDRLFQNQAKLAAVDLEYYALQSGLDTDRFKKCLESDKYAADIEEDVEAGLAIGVTGTPTFVINGYVIPGVIPEDTFRQIIDRLLSQ